MLLLFLRCYRWFFVGNEPIAFYWGLPALWWDCRKGWGTLIIVVWSQSWYLVLIGHMVITPCGALFTPNCYITFCRLEYDILY